MLEQVVIYHMENAKYPDKETDFRPEEKYPESDYDFVKFLSRKFTEQGVELRVDNWEKLYKKLQYDSWIELAKEIRKIAEQ